MTVNVSTTISTRPMEVMSGILESSRVALLTYRLGVYNQRHWMNHHSTGTEIDPVKKGSRESRK